MQFPQLLCKTPNTRACVLEEDRFGQIEAPITCRGSNLPDPMIRVRTPRRRVRQAAKREGESSCRGCERYRSCVLGGYLAWLAKVMKDQCIHLLCTMLCRVVPCSGIPLAYLEGSAVQPFSGGWHGGARVVRTHLGRCQKADGFQYHFCRRAAACLFPFASQSLSNRTSSGSVTTVFRRVLLQFCLDQTR